MAAETGRTVWLPKDSLLVIALYIPVWGLGGLGWGLFMTLFTDGQLIKWLIAGMVWAAPCWFLMSIYLVIAFREVAARIPVLDTTTLAHHLSAVARALRCTVELDSPTSIVATPKNWLARIFEFNKLHIRLNEDNLELTGPAIVVNKLRKRLARPEPRMDRYPWRRRAIDNGSHSEANRTCERVVTVAVAWRNRCVLRPFGRCGG
jgi:hypothetical protein